MKTEMNKRGWWIILLSAISFALLISGCPKSKEAVAPGQEEKKEASEPAPASKETEKESAEAKPAPAPAPSTAPAQSSQSEIAEKAPPSVSAPEETKDPIASGEILLNPALSKDAEKIQTRLADLGLYKLPVDGVWGRGSRAALKTFKEQNLLGSSDRWDKETQIALFRQAGEAPGDSLEAIASGTVFLNPSSLQDARKIQARLQELGLYKGPIDGIWGKGSQGALKAFKEQSSLPNPDTWDKDTQMLLFLK